MNEDNQSKELKLIGKSVTVSSGGVYHVSGTITDGYILVDSSDEVQLILDGCTIKSSDGPAINIQNAKSIIISLTENSVNTIEDGSVYSNLDADEEPNATLFSKEDLIINGKGTLNILANYNNGITSKDTLKILDSTISITSANHGINGKDYLALKDCALSIISTGDAIRSSKGEVVIDSGTYIFNAQEDGIQAQTNVVINNGSFKITTGGGSVNSSTKSDWGQWELREQIEKTTVVTDETSAKGIKAELNIAINGGTFEIDSSDDSIHSNEKIIIENGNISIKSGDDGIHADSEIGINNGIIDISKSYEGIESVRININGGDINVVASDDGINVAGGNDSSSMMRKNGQNSFNPATISTNNILTINDGLIVINSSGDGIDVNGSAFIYGGKIYVNGPTNSGNAALDYDNVFKIDAGLFIAAGSSGMLQSVSNTSLQNTLTVVFDNLQLANTETIVKDQNGNTVIAYTPTKDYQSIVISSSDLKKDDIYTVYVNNLEIGSVKIENINSSIGNLKSGGGMPPNGEFQTDRKQRF